MNQFSRCRTLVLTILFTVCAVLLSRADEVYITAEEVGGDVIFRFQGSIDLTGFPSPGPKSISAFIAPEYGACVSRGNALSASVDRYDVLPEVSLRSFGTGSPVSADSATGDNFGFGVARNSTGVLHMPEDYTSGAPISGTMTFAGATFTSLGVAPTPKSFDTTVGTNTIFLFTAPPASSATAARADLQIGKSFNRLRGNDVYNRRKASKKQTLIRRARIFSTNTQKAALLLQNDGGTAANLKLKSTGDRFPRMKVTARSGRRNVAAAVKTGRFSPRVGPGDSVRVTYRLKTDRFYAGIKRGGDRNDTIRFRLSGGGSRDNATMVVKY